MTDPNRPSDDTVKPAQAGEPVVSKPYIMPDDPEEGSMELLVKEATESREPAPNGRGREQMAARRLPMSTRRTNGGIQAPGRPRGRIVLVEAAARRSLGDRRYTPAKPV